MKSNTFTICINTKYFHYKFNYKQYYLPGTQNDSPKQLDLSLLYYLWWYQFLFILALPAAGHQPVNLARALGRPTVNLAHSLQNLTSSGTVMMELVIECLKDTAY